MRPGRAAGAAQLRDRLTALDPVPGLDAYAARFEVGVERVAAVAEVEDHVGAVGLLEVHRVGVVGNLVAEAATAAATRASETATTGLP
jgi:hypothetical protein